MEIQFANRNLEDRYTNANNAIRAWGTVVARKYIQRVEQLKAVGNEHEIRALPGVRAHRLSGARAGRLALTLHGRWRLEITIEGDVILVEEVSNHYGD
jgi:plasmid maintenance system killer protein